MTVAAGLTLGLELVAAALVIAIPIHVGYSLLAVVVWVAIMFVLILPIVDLFADKIILRGENATDNIVQQGNWGAALLMGAVKVKRPSACVHVEAARSAPARQRPSPARRRRACLDRFRWLSSPAPCTSKTARWPRARPITKFATRRTCPAWRRRPSWPRSASGWFTLRRPPPL